MNPYASARLHQERAAAFQAETAKRRPAGTTSRPIRHRTGWALIQIGLALVTSSARHQHRTVGAELP